MRTRGIIVYKMPEDVSGPDSYALIIRGNGEVRMVHSEGVAYKVSNEKPWCWNDWSITEKKWSPAELVELIDETQAVDLADWVRSFGARLESNFSQIAYWYNETE